MSGSSLFPEDLMINILLRLPVKSTFRMRSVCKNWNLLLRGPKFGYLFNNYQLCRQERLANEGIFSFIVVEYVENDSFAARFPGSTVTEDFEFPNVIGYPTWYDALSREHLFHLDGIENSYDPARLVLSYVTLKKMKDQLITTVDRVEKLDIVFTSIRDRLDARYIRFSNVYGGILCLEDETGVILYNPYTGEFQKLPFRPCTHSRYYHIVLGLWFEFDQPETVKHYKVYTLLVLLDPRIFVIEKYDSIEGSWTEIRTFSYEVSYLSRGNYLLFNGILHLYTDCFSDSLSTLDVRSETFGLLPLPPEVLEWNIINCPSFLDRMAGKCVQIESCYVPHLFVHGRSLALFSGNSDSKSCIDIWIMTEYGVKESWIKQYTIREEFITLSDFDRAPSNDVNPYTFRLWWRLLLNWKCMDEDGMILETRNWNRDGIEPFVDPRRKLVFFNLLSNKLTEIGMRVTGDLLTVMPCVEIMLSLK